MSWKEFRRIQGDVFGLLFAAVLPPDDDEAEPTEEEQKTWRPRKRQRRPELRLYLNIWINVLHNDEAVSGGQ